LFAFSPIFFLWREPKYIDQIMLRDRLRCPQGQRPASRAAPPVAQCLWHKLACKELSGLGRRAAVRLMFALALSSQAVCAQVEPAPHLPHLAERNDLFAAAAAPRQHFDSVPSEHVVKLLAPAASRKFAAPPMALPNDPGYPGLDIVKRGHMPALMCERVTGVDGKWGLLCKPLPPSNTTGMNATQVANEQQIARELAQQAKMLNAPSPQNKAVMHRELAVYHWQESSTFTYIQHKKHFYNVHYADNSALKIETGLDVCGLGPFRFYTRFGLITEAVSGRPGADLQGADGILGFGYTDLPRSASLMKTLTRRRRPNWHLTQPDDMKLMSNNSFAVLSSASQAELHLGGFDPVAVDGEVLWAPMVNLTGYGVNITSVTYGGKELLELDDRGVMAGGTMGVFDSGSTCLNLPRGIFNGYYKTSLFDNFAALASTNPTLPIIVTLNGRIKLEIPQKSWSEPWACTFPFDQNVVLFGHHIFRSYMVIHDMNPPHYHMGFAKISPSYQFGPERTVDVPLKGQRPFVEGEGLVEVAKVPLTLEQRVHLFVKISLGTPPQTFR